MSYDYLESSDSLESPLSSPPDSGWLTSHCAQD